MRHIHFKGFLCVWHVKKKTTIISIGFLVALMKLSLNRRIFRDCVVLVKVEL